MSVWQDPKDERQKTGILVSLVKNWPDNLYPKNLGQKIQVDDAKHVISVQNEYKNQYPQQHNKTPKTEQ